MMEFTPTKKDLRLSSQMLAVVAWSFSKILWQPILKVKFSKEVKVLAIKPCTNILPHTKTESKSVNH